MMFFIQLSSQICVENVLHVGVRVVINNNNSAAHEKHNFNLITAKTMTVMRVYLFCSEEIIEIRNHPGYGGLEYRVFNPVKGIFSRT